MCVDLYILKSVLNCNMKEEKLHLGKNKATISSMISPVDECQLYGHRNGPVESQTIGHHLPRTIAKFVSRWPGKPPAADRPKSYWRAVPPCQN